MRRLQKGKRKKPRKTTKPLAEGIRRTKRGLRNWKFMSDEELVAYACRVVKEKGLRKRSELWKADIGLYNVLRRRELLDRLEFEGGQRDWASMSDEGLVEFAKDFIGNEDVTGRYGLQKADKGLYGALIKRKLIDAVGLENKNVGHRNWKSMSDGELVEFAKDFTKEKKITNRSELQKEAEGLYTVLKRRKLIDALGLEGQRKWKSMNDGELVEFAKDFIRKEGITSKSGLVKADSRLYGALRKRKLIDAVGLEEKRRDWISMNDGELVEFAKDFIRKEGITSKSGLVKADSGLHGALKKRKLIDAVGLENKGAGYEYLVSMTEGEIVKFASEFARKEGITSRSGLKKTKRKLYNVLWRRNLLDRVFPETSRAEIRDWVSMSDKKIVEFAREFIGREGITGRKELRELDSGLYGVLKRRNLIGAVGLEEKRRDWVSMSDGEIVKFAREFARKEGITSRSGLKKADSGLYDTLKNRKLIDVVFAPIESEQTREAVQEVVDAMEEFDSS